MPYQRLQNRQPRQRLLMAVPCLAVLVLAIVAPGIALAGTLMSVSPAGASASITISITGTGFDPVAANNEVSFVPQTGSTVTARGNGITVVNAATGVRRLSVVVPAGLSVGSVALRVKNTITQEVSQGVSIDLLEIHFADVSTAQRGASNLAVRITGSSNTRFIAGTRATFGAGITVLSTTVESLTSLVARISVPTTAALGGRTVGVTTSTQSAALDGFVITDPPPPNRPPRITSAPVTTAREQLLYNYQVQATDPDQDGLTYRLTSAPSGMTIGASGLIAWTPPLNSAPVAQVVVEVSDPAAAKDTQAFAIGVSRAPSVNQPPRITSAPILTGQVSQPYSYDVNAEDPDNGDTLTFRLVQPPSGMTINSSSGLIAWTPAASQSGAFAVEVQVTDLTNTARQAFELTIAGATNVNHPPSAHAGGPYHGEAGSPIAFDGSLSTDPDGDPLTYAWSFGDGSASASGRTPTHAYAQGGSFVVTLTVADGRGGESVRSTSVAVGAAGDHAPPAVAILGPREVLPGDQITLTAQATDNVGVERVTFTVDGGASSETTTPPFQRSIVVPAVASPGTTIQVHATASDAAGNAGAADATLTISARPDTEKPIVELNAPSLASPGTTIHLSASAHDNAGIQSVAFSVNGAAVVSRSEPPYEATYLVPDNTPIGSALAVSAAALDFSGNRTEALADVSIVATADTQPPSVQLTARTTVVAGAALTLAATATDNRGVSAVDFFVDGVKILGDTQAPYVATFDVPANAVTGRTLRLEARAIDFAGLQGTDERQAQIVATSSLAQGTIAGRVYDDATGLPVAGAGIALTGIDASNQAYTHTATSDSRGRYLLRATEGSGLLRITRTGWTRVDRQIEIVANKSVAAFDARLTRLTPGAVPIDPVLGATASGPAGSETTLLVPSGALRTASPIAVTPIGQQGLEGLLPAGWSPVAAADITPHDVDFAAVATLTMPRPADLPARTLVLVRWNEEAAQWRAIETQPAGNAGALSAGVATTGQFAWVLADAAPVAPPIAVAGAPLAGVATPVMPAAATTRVEPQSKIVFYQPGVRSNVRGVVEPSAPVSSGLMLLTRITEAYRFTSGLETQIESYAEDLVFYQAGAASPALGARYVATPSLDFEPSTLQSGVITIELFEPAAGSRFSDLIGDDGGSVTAESGERADVPANGLSTPAAVSVRHVDVADLGLSIPPAFSVVGGLHLLAGGAQFTAPVTISIPKPPQVPSDGQVLIARIAEVDGASRLMLVALGRVSADRIESSIALGPNPSAFEGARVEGRYLFLQPASPVGFANGIVRAVNGDPFTGALVSVDSLPLFALSRATGTYVAAAANGAVTVLAQDVTRHDTGSAQGTIPGAGGVLPIDVRLSAQAPRVLSISPANAAENVSLSNPIVVTFSEPLNPNTITPTSIVLAGPGGAAVAGTIALSNGNSVVTLRPSGPLQADTAFTVTLAASISDLSGYTLGEAVTSRFTSLDVTAPPPPAAGAITASMPDGGTSTIVATQGTAGQRDTVTIVNVTRGTTTAVLVNASGGFSVAVAASLGDELKIRIVDAAGNETFVALPRFSRVNADGSMSFAMDARGGRVDGPGGVAASVKPNTFPAGTVVTLKPVLEADFPISLTDIQRQHFKYSGGVDIDFGGQVPSQYVDVSIPSAASDTATDRWVVGQIVEVNGNQVMQVVDTAKVINGRITTASPPCPGVNARGVYGYYKVAEPLGLTYGNLVRAAEPLILSADVPGFNLLEPFIVTAKDFDQRLPMCLPVLSGRVTVVPNTTTVVVSRDALERGVQRVSIKNLDRPDAEVQFGRESIEFIAPMTGSVSDQYQVTGLFSVGSSEPLPFTISEGAAGQVAIRLGVDAITKFPGTVEIRNVSRNSVVRFPASSMVLKFKVAGGAQDHYTVHVTSTGKGRVPAPAFTEPSPFGPGNLVARAIPSSIDPTQAEIDEYNRTHPDKLNGPARTTVDLIGTNPDDPSDVRLSLRIPDDQIIQGGFNFAFQSDPTLDFKVVESYVTGAPLTIKIPIVRIKLSDTTGVTLREIVIPSPPPDQPVNLGRLSNDHVPPRVVGDISFLENFDPATGVLTFRFSESMDLESLRGSLLLLDAEGNPIEREIHVSDNNTVATIVLKEPLALGASYRVSFFGVIDRGGNPVDETDLSAGGELLFTTVGPRLLSTTPTTPSAGVRDIRVEQKPLNGVPSVVLFATTDTKLGHPLVAMDVTDPAKPTQIGAGTSGIYKRDLTLIPNIEGLHLRGHSPCPGAGSSDPTIFNGDLAATSSLTIDFTYITFFDITNPASPCRISDKLLTATPDSPLFSVTRTGTYPMFGLAARGVATIEHSTGIAAYVAIADSGLFMVDVGGNIPEIPGSERRTEPMLPGDYFDVVSHAGKLLGINHQLKQFEVIDPSLAVLSVTPLPDRPRRLALAEGFAFDANGDGTVAPEEFIDAVFIGGEESVMVLDVTGQTPRLIGSIAMPAPIKNVDVDRLRRRVAVGDNQGGLHLVDVSRMPTNGLLDRNRDGFDDRVIWRRQLTGDIDAVHFDPDRPNLYVGTSNGLEIYGLAVPNVVGRARYTFVPVDSSEGPGVPTNDHPGLNYGASTILPIRGALVELQTSAGAVVQATTTTETGGFFFDAPQGPDLKVVVKAALGGPNHIHLDVIDNTDKQPTKPAYKLESAVFNASRNQNLDLHAQTLWRAGSATSTGQYVDRSGAPFAILDTIYQAETVVRRADPNLTFPLLHIGWSPRNVPSRDRNGDITPADGFIESARYSEADNTVYLRGAQNFDTDEYDPHVILHEWSHYFVAKFSRDDSIGGNHSIAPGSRDDLDPRVSWNEGFANAHAAILAGNSRRADTFGDDNAKANFWDIERDSGRDGGFFSERSVSELVWDLYDPQSEIPETDLEGPTIPVPPFDDNVELGYKPIYQAMRGGVITTPAYNTIFSFLQAVLGTPSFSDPRSRFTVIDDMTQLLKGENIDLTRSDEYEDATRRLYTEIVVDGPVVSEHGPGPFAGQPLTTRLDHDPNLQGNKLDSRVFFKYRVAAAGDYKFTITPVNGKLLALVIRRPGGTIVLKNSSRTDAASVSVTLPPGDYVTEVAGMEAVVRDGKVVGVPAEAIFTIGIKSAPAGTP